MPYYVGAKGSNGCSGYPAVNTSTGEVMGCHDTKEQAAAQIYAINLGEGKVGKEIMENDIDKRNYSPDARRRMATHGEAMPDGSFPIQNETDLRNAIQSVGRASNYAAAKEHIIRRAKEMGLTRILPEDWKNKAEKGMTGWGGSVFDLNPFVK